MVEDKLNYGMAVLNDAPCGVEATIVATGLGRSGTTMLARIMEESGLEMGERLTGNTREYKELQVIIKGDDRLAFESFCKTQSGKTPKWGFKVPAFRNRMAAYEGCMTHPRFIVIFRDMLAISLRNNISIGTELMSSIGNTLKGYSLMLDNIGRLKSPILLISYEKALQFPERTVAELTGFMGFTLSEARIAEIAEIAVRNSDPNYLIHRAPLEIAVDAPAGESVTPAKAPLGFVSGVE